MLLQHAIIYHEARDWICLQNQTQLTYQSLLTHKKLLEQVCEQYQMVQAKGTAMLTPCLQPHPQSTKMQSQQTLTPNAPGAAIPIPE